MTGAAPPPTGFTDRVRQELSGAALGTPGEQRAELSALVRFGGALHVRGPAAAPDRLTLEVETTSGAVARRLFALLQSHVGVRPELRVRAPGGVHRRTTYGVVLPAAGPVAAELALLDADGRPRPEIDDHLVGTDATAAAYLRGALLAAGSVSAPGRPPHLEIAVTSAAVAERLARLAADLTGGHARAVEAPSDGGRRHRVVVKSGEAIGVLLAAVGATTAFLAWDEQRLRRSLRNEANRLANADAANVRRTIEAAAVQTRQVERAIARVGWAGLDEELRSVALARLANPTASLTELGELCEPPIGKSTVHRRLRRLEALATADGH